MEGNSRHLKRFPGAEKAAALPTIVDFPTIVHEALAVFGNVVDTEAARRHCAAYLTGLIVAARQIVRGINRAFVLTTDQSCLYRWLTEGEWDVQTLHDPRLAWLHQAPRRTLARGVIALDHTLVTHEGQLSEDVGWFWDHVDQRHMIAHDDVIAHHGCTSESPYPIEWRRGKTRDSCTKEPCKDHTELCIEWIDDALRRGIPGALTCDSSFTSAQILNHLQSTPRTYVGDLQRHRKGVYTGREQNLQEVARPIPGEAKKPVRMGSTRYGYFSPQMRMPALTHPGADRAVLARAWRPGGEPSPGQ